MTLPSRTYVEAGGLAEPKAALFQTLDLLKNVVGAEAPADPDPEAPRGPRPPAAGAGQDRARWFDAVEPRGDGARPVPRGRPRRGAR